MRCRIAVLLVVTACSGKSDPEPAPQSPPSEPAPAAAAPTPATAPTLDAAPPAPDAASADPGRAWRDRHKELMFLPQAGAPRAKDWPCRATSGDVTWEFVYGGPAACVTPPDELLWGCPTAVTRTVQGELREHRVFAYDAAGQLVAVLSKKKEDGERRIVVTYENGKVAGSEWDDGGDGIVDRQLRFVHTPDRITSQRFSDREMAFVDDRYYALERGRITKSWMHVGTSKYPPQGDRYTYKGSRLVLRQQLLGDDPTGLDVAYAYDCE